MDTREIILHSFSAVGIDISDFEGRSDYEVDLGEYIGNSILFISLIVDLEERLGVQIPDEFLSVESLATLGGFRDVVDGILTEISAT